MWFNALDVETRALHGHDLGRIVVFSQWQFKTNFSMRYQHVSKSLFLSLSVSLEENRRNYPSYIKIHYYSLIIVALSSNASVRKRLPETNNANTSWKNTINNSQLHTFRISKAVVIKYILDKIWSNTICTVSFLFVSTITDFHVLSNYIDGNSWSSQ